jgi:hypothetical protein
MGSYHQMGYNSTNLLALPGLSAFSGAILSPVNMTMDDAASLVKQWSSSQQFEFILDPQIYNVKESRAMLREWSYFPSDVDTADITRDHWWEPITANLAQVVQNLGCIAVCSPTVIPRTSSLDYYSLSVRIAMQLLEQFNGTKRVYLTAIVKLKDLGEPTLAEKIAGVLTAFAGDDVYLILETEKEPRRELDDSNGLRGAMRLIHILEKSGMRVLVSHASSDLVLWKAAGAHSCATGKFFNLRRYTNTRFEEPNGGGGGGGQLPYWFEESLLAFLREPDLLRLNSRGLIGQGASNNDFSSIILDGVLETSTKPTWLANSWRHYLATFAALEARLSSTNLVDIKNLLKTAEQNWMALEDAEVFAEENRNDGKWLRSWRQAIAEFNK